MRERSKMIEILVMAGAIVAFVASCYLARQNDERRKLGKEEDKRND